MDPELVAEPITFAPATFKFDLPVPKSQVSQEPPAYEYLGELPDSYGTKALYLTARDPNWVYAYWDLTAAQFSEATEAAHDHKVFLDLFREGASDRLQQLQIFGGVKGSYLLVSSPGSCFYARLGYYTPEGRFEQISRSGVAHTPQNTLSWKTQTRFATIPFNLSFCELFEPIKPHLKEGEELAECLARLQEDESKFGFNVLRAVRDDHQAETSRRTEVENLSLDVVRQIRVGSMEITEIIRKRLEQMLSSSSGQWGSSWSSPMGASSVPGKSREFFMHVNAELIIYGGTDPKATMQINGQPIKLRDDGTFSYHFTLPDGQFMIPVEATSPDKVETRSAVLSFLRGSDYLGDVKATAQEPRPEPIGRLA